MSIICPNCKHEEIEGAFYCSECATKLIASDGYPTATIKKNSEQYLNSISEDVNTPSTPSGDSLVNLHIVKSGQILPLTGLESFSIGRISEGQSIVPNIDLTPFEAFSQGVSRLHATIHIINNQVSITDLGSSNGTWINKDQISPHQNITIANGDIIMLGKFKIQAIIRQP